MGKLENVGGVHRVRPWTVLGQDIGKTVFQHRRMGGCERSDKRIGIAPRGTQLLNGVRWERLPKHRPTAGGSFGGGRETSDTFTTDLFNGRDPSTPWVQVLACLGKVE